MRFCWKYLTSKLSCQKVGFFKIVNTQHIFCLQSNFVWLGHTCSFSVLQILLQDYVRTSLLCCSHLLHQVLSIEEIRFRVDHVVLCVIIDDDTITVTFEAFTLTDFIVSLSFCRWRISLSRTAALEVAVVYVTALCPFQTFTDLFLMKKSTESGLLLALVIWGFWS